MMDDTETIQVVTEEDGSSICDEEEQSKPDTCHSYRCPRNSFVLWELQAEFSNIIIWEGTMLGNIVFLLNKFNLFTLLS